MISKFNAFFIYDNIYRMGCTYLSFIVLKLHAEVINHELSFAHKMSLQTLAHQEAYCCLFCALVCIALCVIVKQERQLFFNVANIKYRSLSNSGDSIRFLNRSGKFIQSSNRISEMFSSLLDV